MDNVGPKSIRRLLAHTTIQAHPPSTPLTGTAGNKTESQNDVRMNASLFSMTRETKKLQENRWFVCLRQLPTLVDPKILG